MENSPASTRRKTLVTPVMSGPRARLQAAEWRWVGPLVRGRTGVRFRDTNPIRQALLTKMTPFYLHIYGWQQ